MTKRFDLRGILLICLSYVAMWILVCSVFAMLWYSFDALRGHVWRVEDYWRWAMVEWTTIFILGPVAFWSAAGSPIEPPHRLRRFVVHLFSSITFTVLTIVTATMVSLAVEPGNPNFSAQLEQFVTKHGEAGFLFYWVLVMARQTAHLYREKSRRELQATRLQAQLAQSRLQVLKMQLHPHFLFNTLHAAATLAREDAAATEDMLLRLADLLRAYLDDDRHEISLASELELMDLYLGIQRVRFKDRLTSRVGAAHETLGCAVPSLILQPIVENAIQHGIGKHVGEDRIEIDSYRDGDSLRLEVRNHNSSLDKPAEELFERGIGLSNTRLRLRELYGDEAQIQIGALLPHGVSCQIRLPFRSLDAPASRRAEKAA
jgi:hypothetical protein